MDYEKIEVYGPVCKIKVVKIVIFYNFVTSVPFLLSDPKTSIETPLKSLKGPLKSPQTPSKASLTPSEASQNPQ